MSFDQLKDKLEGHRFECLITKQEGNKVFYRHSHFRSAISIRDGRIFEIMKDFGDAGFELIKEKE